MNGATRIPGREYIVFRQQGRMSERLQRALTMYKDVYGGLPASVVVHKSEVDKARQALVELDVRLPVRGLGGCLVPEVWLEISRNGEER